MGLRPQRTCRFTPLQGIQSRPGTRAREFRERKKLQLKKPPAPVPMGPGPGEPSLQGRRQMGKSLGSGAEGEWDSAAATLLGCCVSFQRLSSNLALQLGYFGGGGGGARGRSRDPGSSAQQEGSQVAPQPRPRAGDLGSGDPFEDGEARATDAFPESRAAPGFLLTCPQLPGPLTIYLAPSHRPSGQPTCKTEQHRNYPPGWAVGPGPPDFFLSPTSLLPFSFFPVALCVSLQVSLYCTHTLCLQSPTRSRDTASPGTAPRGRKEEGGGERGRAGRWLEVAVALRAAWRRWGLRKPRRGTSQTK